MKLASPSRPRLASPVRAARSVEGKIDLEKFELREYQVEAIDKVITSWHVGMQRPAAVLPTGAGKTVIFSNLLAKIHEEVQSGTWTWPTGPMVVVAHRSELLQQAEDKLAREAPHLRVGRVKGTKNQIHGVHVIIASVQSLSEKRAAAIRRLRPSVVVVDECHHYVSRTYLEALRNLGCYEEDGPRVLGVSATLARTDKLKLGELWEDVVYELPISYLIERGWLLMPKGRRVVVEGLALDNVKKTAGDLNTGALGEAVSKTAAPEIIAETYKRHAGDRQGIVFAINVELSKRQVEAFRAVGISAAHADGTMHETERDKIVEDFQAGRIQVISNCNLWTEGFDAPPCSAVVVARPTLSRGLYIQMVGRGLRPHPGQTDCLVFDIDCGRSRHSLASVTDLGLDRVEVDEIDGEPVEGGLEIELERKARELLEVRGQTVVEEFDFFETERATPERTAWRQTYKGVWFIEHREGLVVLMRGQEFGRYDIGVWDGNGGRIERSDLTLAEAFRQGGGIARRIGGPLTTPPYRSSWKSQPPSINQERLAQNFGLQWPKNVTSGELSHLISIHAASAKLDTMNLAVDVTREGYWRNEHINLPVDAG